MRQFAFMILNPCEIAGVDKATANLATEIVIGLTDAPPVRTLAHAGAPRPPFIDRHNRRH